MLYEIRTTNLLANGYCFRESQLKLISQHCKIKQTAVGGILRQHPENTSLFFIGSY